MRWTLTGLLLIALGCQGGPAGAPLVPLRADYGAWYLIYIDGELIGRAVDVNRTRPGISPGSHDVLVLNAGLDPSLCLAARYTVEVPADSAEVALTTQANEPQSDCTAEERALAEAP